jgi:zinc protease
MRPRSFLALLAVVTLAAACASPAPPPPVAPAPPPAPTGVAAPTPPSDPLGPKPESPAAPLFVPPTPTVFAGPAGMSIWLVERHEVPMVSCDLTVAAGASSDPKDKGGLAYATARMLFEGAGKLGAIDLARAVDQLGARITTDANADASFVSLTVLRRNLDAAFALFGDVVVKPRFDPAEFKRMKDLWQNELSERQKDPDATARVVYRAVLFGPDNPYGHPWDGTLGSAKGILDDDVRRFYRSAWRPDRATLVCVGDVTEKDLTPVAEKAFGGWKAPAEAAAPLVAPGPPGGPWPRLVLVDRADAPQAVVAVLRPGLAASDPKAPALWRVNDTIGGSFTSRLNQDLREKHGYTYGARSRFSVSRGVGQVVSWANVVTAKTGDALKAMLADLGDFAAGGMTQDEVDRSRSQARGELIGTYQSDEGIAGHLAGDASLGLPVDWAARSAHLRDEAIKPTLDSLAKEFYDPAGAIVVVVGPRGTLLPMLADAGLPAPEMRDTEGRPLPAPEAPQGAPGKTK